jgi:hypothetical protein
MITRRTVFPDRWRGVKVRIMPDAPELLYESNYRNTPLVAVAWAVILATGFASAWAALTFLSPGDALVPVVEIAGLSILLIVAVPFLSARRHRWWADDANFHFREAHRFLSFVPERAGTVPLNQIAALRHVESGVDRLLEVETLSGARHTLAQALVKDAAGIPRPDVHGFNVFANTFRGRIAAAGAAGASFQDGLGFWNRALGLALLGFAFTSTTALSGLILYGILSGNHMPNGAALQGLAFVIVLPLGCAYALYRSWARRSFVLGLDSLKSKLRQNG